MSRFDPTSLMETNAAGFHNVWDARFSNLRYYVGPSTSIVVDSSTSANLPALAHKYLGDQSLWWVILQYNGLFDAIKDIRVGAVLRIPDRTQLISFLERERNTEASQPRFVI